MPNKINDDLLQQIGKMGANIETLVKGVDTLVKEQKKTNAEMIVLQIGQDEHSRRLKQVAELEKDHSALNDRVGVLENDKKNLVWFLGKIAVIAGFVFTALFEFLKGKFFH